jgi:hypothetical protein
MTSPQIDTEKGLILLDVPTCLVILNHDRQDRKGNFTPSWWNPLDFLPAQLEETILVLKKMDIERMGTSHCTGMKAAFRLHQEFGDRFFYGYVGSVLDI